MLLCVNAMFRFEYFWKIWHASMNRWAIRAIYVPLGGNKAPWAVFVIFLFIGMWHETTGPGTEPSWYLWAALNALGVTLEKVLKTPKNVWLASVCAGFTWFGIVGANVPVLFFDETWTVLTHTFFDWNLIWASTSLVATLLFVNTMNASVSMTLREKGEE